MKNLVLTVLYCILSVVCIPFSALAQTPSYSLIGESVTLYADSTLLVPLFTLPSTYFAKVLQEDEEFCKVSYLDVVGFVKTDDVNVVDYVPLNKFPSDVYTKVFNDGNTVTVRSSPSHLKDNVCAKLNNGESVTFYGTRKGTEQIGALGDEWYYIKDSDGNFGYVYNLYAQAPVFPENDYTASEKVQSATVTASASVLPGNGTVLIIALCVPISILLILALKTVKPRSQ